MIEVFQHPVSLWIAAAEGMADWDTIYANYGAAVDYPTCKYWRALAAHCPDAKMILMVRDPEAWFEST